VFDLVVNDLRGRPRSSTPMPCHIINLDTTDNHAEARNAAQTTLQLVDAIHEAGNIAALASETEAEAAAAAAGAAAGTADVLVEAEQEELRRQARRAREEEYKKFVEDDAAVEDMLAELSQHLPFPETMPGRLSMHRWDTHLPELIRQFERKLSKPIDHVMLWY